MARTSGRLLKNARRFRSHKANARHALSVPAFAERIKRAFGKGDDDMTTQYPLRFVRESDYGELINFYHLARTVLSGQACTKYDRMLWAAAEFAKTHPYVTATGAYKDLSANLEGY